MKFAHVYNQIERPSNAIIEGFRQISSATAHEASGKKGALTSAIKPVAAGMKVCGPALTVLCRSKDNLMLHKAIAVAQPGDRACRGYRRQGRSRLLGRNHDRIRTGQWHRRPGHRQLRARC